MTARTWISVSHFSSRFKELLLTYAFSAPLTDHPLATGFPLKDGKVAVKMPTDIDSTKDYFVVLFGDSVCISNLSSAEPKLTIRFDVRRETSRQFSGSHKHPRGYLASESRSAEPFVYHNCSF